MSDQHVLFYTAQTQLVLDTIEAVGVYKVKKSFIDKKYGSVASVMHQAYRWLSRVLETHVEKPQGCDYPVWLFQEPDYALVHPSQKLLKLSIPVSELLSFDNHGWERVLSMSYVGKNRQEEVAYDDKLRRMGIQTGQVVFDQAFYPIQKQEIIRSWQNIFIINDKSIVRGAVWQIKKEWIVL